MMNNAKQELLRMTLSLVELLFVEGLAKSKHVLSSNQEESVPGVLTTHLKGKTATHLEQLPSQLLPN